jgi:cobalamin synthase
VSDVLPQISERQLWLGMVKVALLIAVVLLIGALVFSTLLGANNWYGSIGVTALMFAVAMSMLANGFLCLLGIVDWFEARRKAKHD